MFAIVINIIIISLTFKNDGINNRFIILTLIITTIYWRSKLRLKHTWISSEEEPQSQNRWYFKWGMESVFISSRKPFPNWCSKRGWVWEPRGPVEKSSTGIGREQRHSQREKSHTKVSEFSLVNVRNSVLFQLLKITNQVWITHYNSRHGLCVSYSHYYTCCFIHAMNRSGPKGKFCNRYAIYTSSYNYTDKWEKPQK